MGGVRPLVKGHRVYTDLENKVMVSKGERYVREIN